MFTIISFIPFDGYIALAAGDPVVTSVDIGIDYEKGSLEKVKVTNIRITGSNLTDANGNPTISVVGEPVGGSGTIPLTRTVTEKDVLAYRYEGEPALAKVFVAGKPYDIESLPSVTGVKPREATSGSEVKIEHNGKDDGDVNYTISDSGNKVVSDGPISNGNIVYTVPESNIVSGKYYLKFSKQQSSFEPGKPTVNITKNYPEIFSVIGDLNIDKNILMTPNQGRPPFRETGTNREVPGTKVYLYSNQLLDTKNMSVFLFRDGDPFDFKKENMAKNLNYTKGTGGNKDEFIFEVPKLPVGTYQVVLTNYVGDVTGNIKDKVVSVSTFRNNKFNIIDGEQSVMITDVRPRTSSESGKEVLFVGKNILKIPEDTFSFNDVTPSEVTGKMNGKNTNNLNITYENINSDVVGEYKRLGAEDKGIKTYKIKRDVKIYIGSAVDFIKYPTYEDGDITPVNGFNDINEIDIRVNRIDLKPGENPEKDVTVEVVTRYYFKKDDEAIKDLPIIGEEDGYVYIDVKESDLWDKKFIFTKESYVPEIKMMTPDIIPVDRNNYISPEFKVYLHGTGFVKHRYMGNAGGSSTDKVEKLKMPTLNFGNKFILDPNIDDYTEIGGIPRFPAKDMKIFKENGMEVDGKNGNNVGEKLVVTLPANALKEKGLKILDKDLGVHNLILTNPEINDKDVEIGKDPGSYIGEYPFRFKKVEQFPSIESINPRVVSTDGHKNVVLKGTNFSKDLKVFLDGEEIKNVKRDDIGTELIFDVPPKNEGIYEIIVQNQDTSGVAKTEIIYVTAYTDISFTDFNPKHGTKDTLVTVKGSGFVTAANTKVSDITGIGVYKILGTRVLLDGEDINEYNTETSNNSIKLEPFSMPDGWIKNEDGEVVADKNHHAVILVENGVYYSINKDFKTGAYVLSDGSEEKYIFDIDQDELVVRKGNTKFNVEIKQDEIVIKDAGKDGSGATVDKVLKVTTPYKTEGGKIVGKRVEIINDKELVFRVPEKNRSKYYDVTVMNPDTKSVTKSGNNGFFYELNPLTRPKIEKIDPSSGSIEGGYEVKIMGEEFADQGFDHENRPTRVKVYVGSVQVPDKDIEVSPDRKTIYIKKMPKYPGDLLNETNLNERTVPVVVVNPDGASDDREKGFTYIGSLSNPIIDKVIESEAPSIGGNTVFITGDRFMLMEAVKGKDIPPVNEKDYNDANKNGRWDDLRQKQIEIDEDGIGVINIFKLKEERPDLYEKYVIPVLPKVYFDGVIAEIVNYSPDGNMIEVIVPRGVSGDVEVYLTNNDLGTSNRVKFKYNASNPTIDSIAPNKGRRQGNQNIIIKGKSFEESQMYIYSSKDLPTSSTKMTKVKFGAKDTADTNMTNANINGVNDPNSGVIKSGLAKVTVGDLTVEYEAGNETLLNISLKQGDKVYKLEGVKYDNKEKYFPLSLLKLNGDESLESYSGTELVKFDIRKVGTNNISKLLIERGYSPNVTYVNENQVVAKSPTYYTIGKVKVELINPDDEKGVREFEYVNPDSNPVIINVTNDGREGKKDESGKTVVKVSHTGGSKIKITGKDFRQPVKIYFDGTELNALEGISGGPVQLEYAPKGESYSQEISFTMPAVAERYASVKPMVIVVQNEDGGAASSDPIYIQFTSPESTGMKVTGLVPNFGPSSGGTEVTIHGADFRKTMDGYDKELEVFFERAGEIKKAEIVSVTHDRIVIKTPAFTPGKVNVRVVNPDGNSVRLLDGFTYMSSPTITSVVDPKNDKRKIETISLEGGEKIKIKGTDFMPGAKVVFNPKLKEVQDNETVTGNVITIGKKKYILESGTTVEAKDVEFIDAQNLLVTTPEGKNGDKGVIVINPDNGATNVYDILYGIPEIGSPMDVHAEVVFDQFIRVTWDGVSGAREYEIYMSENGKSFEYIGSTELTAFTVSKLRTRTDYQFLVRAMGQYGTSKPIDESKSNTVTTGRNIGPEDVDGEIGEKTQIKRQGEVADIILGTEDYDTKGIMIDLTRGDLIGVKDITIRIPASIVTSYVGDVSIRGKDYSMKFNPSVFTNTNMVNNKTNKNAGVVYKVTTFKGNPVVKAGETVVGGVYSLEAVNYVNETTTQVDRIVGNIIFSLDQDYMKVNSRRLNNIRFARNENGNWVLGNPVNRMGLYTLIGSRR